MSRHQIALIGASGVGKTCFLAVLRWLGLVGKSGFATMGADGDSKKELDRLTEFLRAKKVPGSTDKVNRLVFPEQYKNVQFLVDMHDFKGEDLKRIDSTWDIYKSWVRSNYYFVLLDIEDDLLNQTPKRTADMEQLFNVLMREDMALHQKSVAILLMKADVRGHTTEKDGPEAALAFLEENNPTFLEKLRQFGVNVACFFVSPLGCSTVMKNGESYIPDNPGLRPFGYQQLFDWFLEEEEKRKTKEKCKFLAKWAVRISPVLLVLLSIWGGFAYHKKHGEDQAREQATNPGATIGQIATATHEMSHEDLARLTEEQVAKFQKELEEAQAEETIRAVIAKIRQYENTAQIGEIFKVRLDQAIVGTCQRLEELLVQKIETAKDDPDACRSLITDYIKDKLIAHESMERVQTVQAYLVAKERSEERAKIKAVQLYPFSAQKLQEKMALVQKYKFESEEVKVEADRAVDAMNLLLTKSTFHLTSFNVGSLKSNRRTFLVWGIGSDAERLAELFSSRNNLQRSWDGGKTDYQNGKEPQWDTEQTVVWQPGKPIRIEWRWNAKLGLYDCVLGVWDRGGDDPLLFLRFLQKLELDRTAPWRIDVQSPWIRVTCREFPDPQSDLDAIEKFLLPGIYWQEFDESSEVK